MKKPRPSSKTRGSISSTSGMSVVSAFIGCKPSPTELGRECMSSGSVTGGRVTIVMSAFRADQIQKILAVIVLHRECQGFQLPAIDKALMVGDFFDAGDLQSLALFDGLHVVGGLHQRFVGAGVQPGEAAA